MKPWKFREVEIAFTQRENRNLCEEKVGSEYTEVMGKEIVTETGQTMIQRKVIKQKKAQRLGVETMFH